VGSLAVLWAAVALTVVVAASTLPWLPAAAAAAVVAVRSTSPTFVTPLLAHLLSMNRAVVLTKPQQLPFNVGWQDLKDLFRQAGKQSRPNISCHETRIVN
jgi:cell division protein FtsW (lipid II flippase)